VNFQETQPKKEPIVTPFCYLSFMLLD